MLLELDLKPPKLIYNILSYQIGLYLLITSSINFTIATQTEPNNMSSQTELEQDRLVYQEQVRLPILHCIIRKMSQDHRPVRNYLLTLHFPVCSSISSLRS